MPENQVNERKVVDLSIDDILPNRFQPRIKFDDSAIFELSESIKAHGVFQPIIVRPIGDKYEIIAGERRYKASVLANKKLIPAIVMDLDDNDTVEIALIENVQRANLTPIEEAISYKKILDMGYMNQDQLAVKLGKTQSTIANKLRLLNLDEDVQEALLENKISERHARSLLKLKDYEQQRIMLKRIINERLTVRKTDEEIDKMFNNENTTNTLNNQPINIPEEIPSIPEIVEENNSNDSIFGFGSSVTSPFMSNEVINTNEISEESNNSTVINANMQQTVTPVEATVMDVDKIANEAHNFNVEKPIAPMDEFLETNKVEEETPVNEPVFTPGKFFNFIEEEPVTEETVDYNESKNFNFDDLYKTVSPVENQLKQASAENINTANEPVLNNQFIPSTPVNEIVQPSQEVPVSSVNEPVQEDSMDNIFTQFINNIEKEEKQAVQPIEQNNNPFGFNIPQAEIKTEEPVITAPVQEPIYQNVVQPQANIGKNIMAAVQEIRNAAEKIKQLGFEVDIDEIDLETMYQLIVKIEK